MAEIFLDIKTNANLQAFAQLDAEQRKAVLEAGRLQVQLKQAEAAAAMYGNAAQQAHAKTAASANAAERAQRKLNESYTQRMGLRHGSGAVLTQSTRQIVRQINEQGGEAQQWSGHTREVIQDAGATSQRRGEIAAALRARRAVVRQHREQAERQARHDRNLAERAEMDGLSAGNNRLLDSAIDAERNPYLLGGASMIAAGRGVRRPGEDRHMDRARRRVAQNVRQSAELAGRVTDEEFDQMSRQMAGRLETRSQQWGQALGVAAGVATAAVAGLTAVSRDDSARREGALSRDTSAVASRRELKQISGSGREYRELTAISDELGRRSGMTGEQANAAVFAGKSADLIDKDFVETVAQARRLNLDPGTALGAVQKVKTNFGDQSGSTQDILGKLLIAAGPSPANVTDIAAGVGTAASGFAAMGGTGDELLAMLGVLSGPNKNVDASAERIKSVSDQINKKRGRIVEGDKPLEGLALIRALPRYAREGRLRGERGDQSTLEDFLGEQNAVSAVRDIDRQGTTIGAQVNKMGGAGVAKELADRAEQYDPTTAAVDRAERNKRRRELAEQDRYTRDEAVADAVQEGHRTHLAMKRVHPVRLFINSTLDQIDRSGLIGDGRTYASRELYRGNVHDDDTRRGVFENLLSAYDRPAVENFQKEVEAGRGEVFGLPRLTRSGPGENNFIPPSRAMTADDSKAATEAARARIKAIDESVAGGKPAVTPDWGERAMGLLPEGLSDGFTRSVRGAKTQAGLFGGAPDAYIKNSGLDPNDYRVKIYRQVAERKAREAAPAVLAGNFLGGDRMTAGAFVAAKAGEIGEEADEETFGTNLKLIDEAEAASKAEMEGSTQGTARHDRASARYKGIRGLKRQAKASGGRVDAMEAQGIVDQISGANGDEKFKSTITDMLQKLVDGLGKLAPPAGANAAPAVNTTPAKFKPPEQPTRGTRQP